MRGRLRRIGTGILLAGASTALTLLVILVLFEIGLRLFERRKASKARARAGVEQEATGFWAVFDEDLAYRLTPGFGDVNDQGFLGPAVSAEKRSFRLLMLGDSVGFYGDGPGDTYVGLLASLLAADPSLDPIEVINASVPGYTNYQELIYLRKFGLGLEPDLVGVGFVLNDLHRFLHVFQIEDGKIVGDRYSFAQEAEDRVEHPLFRLARKSRALLWLKDHLALMGTVAELAAPGSYTFEYRPDFAPAWQAEAWRTIESQLAEMKELSEERGFRLFVHLFPYGQQLRSDYQQRDLRYVMEPQGRLRELCDRLGIAFLDLTPFLSRDRHLIEDDVHLTAAGRREVASRLSEFLRSADLLPRAAVVPRTSGVDSP